LVTQAAMNRLLSERLQTLDSEYEKGQGLLTELDTKRTRLTQTLLRIDGARQVLRELLAESEAKPMAPRPESQTVEAEMP
jgi:predicted nuclease with TOPRIM domain